jgi:hypothetical protein
MNQLAKAQNWAALGAGDYITSWNKYGSFAPCGDPDASTGSSGKTLPGCYQKLAADAKGAVVFYEDKGKAVTKTLKRRAEGSLRNAMEERRWIEFVVV